MRKRLATSRTTFLVKKVCLSKLFQKLKQVHNRLTASLALSICANES
jgi:hypothetical protein